MELKDKGRQIVLESSAFYPAHSYWIIAPEAHFVLCFLILMLFDFSNFYDSLIYRIYISKFRLGDKYVSSQDLF